MRVIITGGGTGGHIYPGISVARVLVESMERVEILFVGSRNGMEKDIIPREGFNLELIDIRGFRRKLSTETLKTFFLAGQSLFAARRILRRFKPDVVFGTGGYACGPIVMMASLMRIPILLHEQNALPGMTNRFLARFVRGVAVTYEESLRYFHRVKEVAVTGNPVRKSILTVSRSEGASAFGLSPFKKTLFVFGGSQGSRSINNAVIEMIDLFREREELQLIFQTGSREYESVLSKVKAKGIDPERSGNIVIRAFIYNMPEAYAASDLAICRAGATSMAELTAKGIPAILIPLPWAAENHQEHNARVFAGKGAGYMITEDKLSGAILREKVEKVFGEEDRLKSMSEASRGLGRADSAKLIRDIIVRFAEERS